MSPSRPLILLCLAGALAASETPRADGAPGGKPPQGPNPEELFRTADADGDGKVTRAELAAALEKPRRAERERMFASMDGNGDGSVTKEEFLAFEPPAPPNQDGRKPGQEGRPPGQEGKEGKEGKDPKRRGPDVDELFKRLDRDGDGVLTREEMARPQGRDPFAEADTDHDGQLSKEEIQAARERAGKEPGEHRDGGDRPGKPPGADGDRPKAP